MEVNLNLAYGNLAGAGTILSLLIKIIQVSLFG